MDAKPNYPIIMRRREPFACRSCRKVRMKCEKDYDTYGPQNCIRCQTRGIQCEYPTRSRVISPKKPAPYKPARNINLSNQFAQCSAESISGSSNRAGTALQHQCATDILNASFVITSEDDVNTALSGTNHLSAKINAIETTEVAQSSHQGVIILAESDTLFNPALSSGDFRMNLTGVQDRDLIRIIAAWSCSPCLCSENTRCQFCILEDCSTAAARQ